MIPFEKDELADWSAFQHRDYIEVDHQMFQQINEFDGEVEVFEDVQELDEITWNYIDPAQEDDNELNEPVRPADPQPIQPERTPALPPPEP